MNEDQLEILGQKIDQLESLMVMINNTMLPPDIHVSGMRGSLPELRDDLKNLYFDCGGEDVWE